MRQDMGGLQISLEKKERPWINGPERVCGSVFLEYLEMGATCGLQMFLLKVLRGMNFV